MKSINKTLTALVASLFLMASCSLLEVENTSQNYGSSYWNSTSEVESYLIGTYTQFRTTLNTLEYFDRRSDEFVSGLEGGTSDSWSQNLSSSNGISWANFYTVVQHCNMILKYSDDVNFTLQSQKDNILAQAYALRAYSFFSLVRLWGDVPLELKPTESSTKEKLGRSPASEVLDQAIADTKKAIELFTDEWVNGKSYATKHA